MVVPPKGRLGPRTFDRRASAGRCCPRASNDRHWPRPRKVGTQGRRADRVGFGRQTSVVMPSFVLKLNGSIRQIAPRAYGIEANTAWSILSTAHALVSRLIAALLEPQRLIPAPPRHCRSKFGEEKVRCL